MSSIVVNFPDCAKLGSREPRTDDNEHDTITITTEGCPAPMPGPPPVFGTGEIIAFILVAVALVAGVVIVRFAAHENKPAKLEARNRARQIELDAEIRKIEASRHQRCDTCGSVYDPAVS